MVVRNAGFEVCIATSAESAMALLRSDPIGPSIGAVVTDHMLPGASGAEFISQLRRIQPGIPVIVITGLPDAEPEYAGLNVVFRQKPCPPEELIALLQQCMRQKAA
jgi:DNA-binding response OmpR family regulator